MQDTQLLDLLSPWLVMMAILVPLIFAERWVHQHFFGIGYLISKDKLSATRLFYVFFLPGIFIHEAIQWLVAGALNVPIKQVVAWPDKQENGTLRLDFIVVNDKATDPLRASLVAAAPFMIMSVMVWYISTQILDLHAFTSSLGSGNVEIIWTSFTDLFRSSNFILWFYLLFVLANSMVPKRSEARGIPLLIAILVIVMVVMVVIGLDGVLIETLGGPVAEALDLVNTALLTILIMDVIAIFLLGLTEDTLERFRGFKMDYSGGENITRAAGRKKRQPGSDEPIPKGEPLPSIYSMALPLPDPSERPRGARPATAGAGAGISVRETSAREPSAERSGTPPARPSVVERAGAAEKPASRRGDDAERPAAERPGSRRSAFGRDAAEKPASRFGRGGDDDAERPASERTGSRRSTFGRDAEDKPASRFGRGGDDDAERPAAERPGSRRSAFGRDEEDKPASRFGRGDDAERPAAERTGSRRSAFGRDAEEKPASRFGRGDDDADRQPSERTGSRRSAFGRDAEDKPASRFGRGGDDDAERPAAERTGSRRSLFNRDTEDKPAQPAGRFSRGGDDADRQPSERPARPTGQFRASESSGRRLERPAQPARRPFGSNRPTREESDEDDTGDDVRYEPLDDVEIDPDFDDINQDIYEDE